MKKRGRPATKNVTHVPSLIDFGQITILNQLNIDPRMLNSMKTGMVVDELFSEEGGIPCASNYMINLSCFFTTVLTDI